MRAIKNLSDAISNFASYYRPDDDESVFDAAKPFYTLLKILKRALSKNGIYLETRVSECGTKDYMLSSICEALALYRYFRW